MPSHRTVLRVLAVLILALPLPAHARDDPFGTPIELDGFPLSLSPDGSWIAGMDANGTGFCVWPVETLEPVCDGEIPDLVEVRSVTWSPDSTAVAFTLDAPNRLVDSDIYVFETENGTLNNLTEDDPDGTGADRVSLVTPQEQIVPIDRFPAWSPDGESLVFARTLWGEEDAPGVSVMTIPRDGGEPQELAVIEASAALPVVGPMAWRADESILLSTRHPDPQNQMNGLWTLQPDGELARLLDGTAGSGVTEPVIADLTVDGRVASVYSRLALLQDLGRVSGGIFYHVDLESSAVTPWEEYPGLELAEGAMLFAAPVFGPDDRSVAFLSRTAEGTMSLSILDANGEITTVIPIEYGFGRRVAMGTGGVEPAIHWAANGTMLVILASGGTVINLPAGDAAAIATPS